VIKLILSEGLSLSAPDHDNVEMTPVNLQFQSEIQNF